MSDIKQARYDKGWIRCSGCGHKLSRIVSAGTGATSPMLEFKCHSCKTINYWRYTSEQKSQETF